jgi:hypothetical protein
MAALPDVEVTCCTCGHVFRLPVIVRSDHTKPHKPHVAHLTANVDPTPAVEHLRTHHAEQTA